MRRVRVDFTRATVLDGGHYAAAGNAHGAVGVKMFGGD